MGIKSPARKVRYTPRSAKGLEMASRNKATLVVKGLWGVTSSDGSKRYTVTFNPIRCSCPDHQYRSAECKHIGAAALAALGC